MDEQRQVENDVAPRKRQAMPAQAVQRMALAQQVAFPGAPGGAGGGASDSDGPAVDVRITGFWRWRNVIVPPNAYVVHTRRGVPEPVHCGLGTSFRFNPITDSFL